jgi:peptide/nickel transport system permease protein
MSAGPPASTAEPRRGGVGGRHGIASTPSTVIGMAIVVLLLFVAAAAPLLCAIEGQDPYTYHLDALTESGRPVGFGGGITGSHWFGVEPVTGRDVFAVVAYGARTSLLIGLSATAGAVVVGVFVGSTAGYFGGWYDRIASRTIDVLFGFPGLIFMIALGAIAPAGFPRPLLIILVIGFFGWPAMARVVRGQTIALRQRSFVTAAIALGMPARRVLVRHVLPNLLATTVVYATFTIPGMIGAEAALSFLGVGMPPPTPDWGRSIHDAIAWVQTDAMFLVFPGAALFLATLSFNLLGDGLRDALDPRLRGVPR